MWQKRLPQCCGHVILHRIRRGDYGRGHLPSTRKPGEEVGVRKFSIIRAYRLAEKKGVSARSGASGW
jgi:DNA-binding transcriptional regulator YhcF (GntR family)